MSKSPRNDKSRSKRKKKKQAELSAPLFEQDEYFYFIAGYTPGGAPYGITWEEAAEQGLLDDGDGEFDKIGIDIF